VIDPHGGLPGRRRVAGFTRCARLNVRSVLARGLRAVVAARAIGRDARVVERGRAPRERRMTRAAFSRRSDVAGVFAVGNRAVVAGRARPQDLHMIDPQHG